MDIYFVHTLADFRVVEDIQADVVMQAAFHDDTLEVQHSVHILVVHTVALPVDSYSVDILVLQWNEKTVFFIDSFFTFYFSYFLLLIKYIE